MQFKKKLFAVPLFFSFIFFIFGLRLFVGPANKVLQWARRR